MWKPSYVTIMNVEFYENWSGKSGNFVLASEWEPLKWEWEPLNQLSVIELELKIHIKRYFLTLE